MVPFSLFLRCVRGIKGRYAPRWPSDAAYSGDRKSPAALQSSPSTRMHGAGGQTSGAASDFTRRRRGRKQTRLKDPSGAGKNIRRPRLRPERISTTAQEASRASCKAGCRCRPRSRSWRIPLLPRGFISLFGIYEAAPFVCDRRHFFALLAPILRAKSPSRHGPRSAPLAPAGGSLGPPSFAALSHHAVQRCRHISVLVSINPGATCGHESVLRRYYFGLSGRLVSGFSFSAGAARRPARPWRLSRLA